MSDDQVSTPIHIEPVRSTLVYRLSGGERAVDPHDLAVLLEHIGDLIAAGMPGAKITDITLEGDRITVEVR